MFAKFIFPVNSLHWLYCFMLFLFKSRNKYHGKLIFIFLTLSYEFFLPAWNLKMPNADSE